MRLKLGDPWRRFAAEQVISIDKPGFAWLARMQAMPLLSARVLDCYVDGEGLLEARLLGSLPLARVAGAQADRGELMRYLAELAWAPHAMLYNPQLSWRGNRCEDGRTVGREPERPGAGAAALRER